MKTIVSIAEEEYDEAIKKAISLSSYPVDIVEWRVDKYADNQNFSDVANVADDIKNASERPLLFTIRTIAEGGEWAHDHDEYRELNRYIAYGKHADYVDVEMFLGNAPDDTALSTLSLSLVEDISKRTQVIGSYHSFDFTPSYSEMYERLANMSRSDVTVVKLATMPDDTEDVYELMRAVHDAKGEFDEKMFIGISMGELGAASRVMGKYFGSGFTFATLGEASAPGQLTIDEMAELLRRFG